MNVSTPAMTTLMFPRGFLDDMLLIQNKFPIKNKAPAMVADMSCNVIF